MRPQAVRALIADHLGVGLELVRDDAHLAQELGADSLDMVELAMRFEQELDIAIGDEESERCATVGDAVMLIQAKLARGKAAA
jgi:acyl carrier protein